MRERRNRLNPKTAENIMVIYENQNIDTDNDDDTDDDAFYHINTYKFT
jgi:hypothetical protein